MKPRLVLTTIDSPQRARKLAKQLVEEQLAACVQIIPNITSLYRWQGKVARGAEELLIIKTTQPALARLTKRLGVLHPYETPEIITLTLASVEKKFKTWWKNSMAHL